MQIPFLPLDVPPYLLGLDPTLYFDRSHLSKYILQLAKIKKLEKALDKIEQNAIINKSPVEGLICECAGIGRQARLRGVCFTTYGFKSRHSHHRKDLIPCVSSLFYFMQASDDGT